MSRPNTFAAGSLDRASHRRQDRAWLDRARSSEASRVTLVWRSKSLVVAGDEPRVAFVGPDFELPDGTRVRDSESLVLLGTDEDSAVFASDISHFAEPLHELDLPAQAELLELRAVAGLLEPSDGSLLAYARAMMSWLSRHRHCGSCGSPTRAAQAGHSRVCMSSSCESEIFTRTDPAVIMLVFREDRCLLGRQASWASGVFSALAGFVEPGESLEDAVRREVKEEVDIRVGACTYSSSQPWPFPSSLMLGFHAAWESGEIDVDTDELEDARWFSRDQILARQVRLPPRLSIARRLIDDWLRGDAG